MTWDELNKKYPEARYEMDIGFKHEQMAELGKLIS